MTVAIANRGPYGRGRLSTDTVLESLFARVSAEPQREILHFCEEGDRVRSVTWESFGTEIRRYAEWFSEVGVGPGQRILLMMDSGLEFWFAFLAAQVLGCTPVAVSPPLMRLRSATVVDKVARVARQCRAALLVGRKPYLELATAIAESLAVPVVDAERIPASMRPLRRDPALSPIALIQFSSGTTGAPQGVVIDQAALRANLRALQKACAFGPGESWANWCPLYHDMGLIFSLAAIEAGMPLYFQSPLRFLAKPVSWLRILSRHRVTRTTAPNFGYSYCTHKIADEDVEGLDLSAWKVAYTAAEPIRRATNEQFVRRFARAGAAESLFAAAYGMAENTVIASCTRKGAALEFRRLSTGAGPDGDVVAAHAEVACVGVPVEGTTIRITDETGAELRDGRVGHIQLSGTSLMRGLLGEDGSLPPPRPTPWWHDSGDLGFMERGELYFCGRAKDLIIKAGNNIYPDFIEEALAGITQIRTGCVAAVGLYDAAAGTEQITVFAEVREGAAALADLRRTAFRTILEETGVRVDRIVLLAPYQVRKTTSGKVQRRLTARSYESGELEVLAD